jgi:uncharacterized membrane protein YfcA
MAIVEIAVLGVAAGVMSGLFGVGGGVIFVPLLTLVLGLGQLDAEATSLAAIVPVVAVGAWRQDRAGLVRRRPAVLVGLASLAGVIAGASVATSLSDATLRRIFGLFLVGVAVQFAVRAWRHGRTGSLRG